MEKLFVGLIPTAPDNFPTGICRQWVGDQVVLQSSETRIIYIHNFHHHHHHHLGMRKNLAVKTVIVFWGTTVLVDSCPALTTTIKSIKRRRYFTDIWKFIRRFIISSLSVHTVITRTGRTGNRHKNKQGVNTPWGGTFSTAIVPVIDPAEWHTGPYCQVYIAACESATRRGLFQRDRKRWTAAGATAGGRDEDDAKCTASIDGTTREMTDTTDVSTNQMLLP
ncbi:hypothetical protein IV203_037031 [Nitzschia inconspicua]|uniref:Uncharacterized protein n=1 Tax=Nitzschia inconspicua TaxID=303405 RepID=A0A9K3LK06_9STRA|nr:hypothetical protein IV203_037031 [Nitzschia inconspicua]